MPPYLRKRLQCGGIVNWRSGRRDRRLGPRYHRYMASIIPILMVAGAIGLVAAIGVLVGIWEAAIVASLFVVALGLVVMMDRLGN